jgi:hypothetical protein
LMEILQKINDKCGGRWIGKKIGFVVAHF